MGLKWKVGSGKLINVWDDRWLPEPGQKQIASPKVYFINWVLDIIFARLNAVE